MAIKTLTFSVLTGGVLALAYATWSKRRAAPKPPPVQRELESEPMRMHQPHREPVTLDEPTGADDASRAGPGSIDVDLEGLWDSADARRNPNEELIDFSSDVVATDEDEDGPVAPEGLGVRWLARATEAMSPFHHAISVRDEAEAALLENAASDEEDTYPESSERLEPGALATRSRDE